MTAVQAATTDPAGELALPTRRDEAWRYAPHAELGRLAFGPAPQSPIGVPEAVEAQMPAIDGPLVVLVNGVIDAGRSRLDELPAGLALSSLASMIDQRPDAVAALAAHVDSAVDDPADAFVAINGAMASDGAVIQVEADVELDTPIHVVDIVVPDPATNASCSAVVIDVGQRSRATVVHTCIGGGDDFGGTNTRTTIRLDQHAALEHIVLQDAPATQIHLSRIDVDQESGSEFRARSFNLGASYGRIAYRVHLGGEGALVDLSGLYFGFGDQVLDQQVTVVHGAENCTSRQSFRGVLDDASTGVFNGGIDVNPGADGTDAEQSNDNLLLSARAEINTQPRLEILADDVACKHGATVGQLDEDALYYLRSRGIGADEARRLLINGFADQTVDDVGSDVVRAWVVERLGHEIGGHDA